MNLNEFAEVLAGALKEKKQTGSDYTATVTRVDGSTAYVQVDGSDIADTPASMAISCKPGDRVRMRVVEGKSWITGNDTAPPADNKDVEADIVQVRKGINDLDTIIIKSRNFSLDADGNVDFSGRLKAAGGTFKGTLEGADGSFTGKIRATEITAEKQYNVVYTDPYTSVEYDIPFLSIRNVDEGSVLVTEAFLFPLTDEQGQGIIGRIGDINVSPDNLFVTTVFYYGLYNRSDARLKHDIADTKVDDALGIVNKLKFREFFWNRDDSFVPIGLIAQEAKEIDADMVSASRDGTYSINVVHLLAVATKSIQELSAKNEELEKRITQLEKRLEALEDKQ